MGTPHWQDDRARRRKNEYYEYRGNDLNIDPSVVGHLTKSQEYSARGRGHRLLQHSAISPFISRHQKVGSCCDASQVIGRLTGIDSAVG